MENVFVLISGLSVFGVACLYSFVSILLRRRFVDPEDSAKLQLELKKWKEDKEEAKKSGDKKLQTKARKQEKRMMQIQGKMMKGQLISMAITMGLFFVMYQGLLYLFGNQPVAFLPFNLAPFASYEVPYEMPFFYWYMICSLFSTTIINKILGIEMGMGMGMPSQT
jgi:uncharacterized membrane protein (DUF106 family)